MLRLTKWLIILVMLPLCSPATPIVTGRVPVADSLPHLTLDQVNSLARDNYPAIRRKDLVRKTSALTIANLNKNFLPQFSINGQASYQSDVTEVDVPIPGIKIDAPSKDQYRVTADISQTIYDGGVTKQQKSLQELNARVEDQQVEVELYQVQDRINQIFLSVLYTDEQIRQVQLVQQDLNTGLKRVQAQLQNGTAFRSNVNVIQAELIKADQRLIELGSARSTLLQTLSLFINRPIDDSTILEKPVAPSFADTSISRPEIALFNNQITALAQQNRLIHSRNLPKTNLFFQGGYGRPGLNLLQNEFDLFYITGVRLNWSLGGLYTSRNEKKLVSINQDIVNTRRDVFLLNTRADVVRQQNEIKKLQDLIRADQQIVELRNSVTAASRAQLENGVITASDYLREVNAEDQARQTLISHEVQLLQAQIQLKMLAGK